MEGQTENGGFLFKQVLKKSIVKTLLNFHFLNCISLLEMSEILIFFFIHQPPLLIKLSEYISVSSDSKMHADIKDFLFHEYF